MNKTEIAKLLEKYKNLAEIHANVDYNDMPSVKKANQAVDEMREISSRLIQLGDKGLNSFAKLLSETENNVRNWAAIAILESEKFSPAIENKALAFLEIFSEGRGINSFGTKVWLENWKVKNIKTRGEI